MAIASIIEKIQQEWGSTGAFLIVLGFIAGGQILYQIFFKALKQWAKSERGKFAPLITLHLYWPGMFLFIVISILICFKFIHHSIDSNIEAVIDHALLILLIISIAYYLIRVIKLFTAIMRKYYNHYGFHKFKVRRVNTQLRLVEQMLSIFIGVTAFAVIMMTFKSVREFGTTILASAGIIGVIIGLAAQKSVTNFIAGVQVAAAQPFKIGDIVVVEGYWGWIEEVNLTNVIVKVWDLRRVVFPINYFTENHFENWTRNSEEIMGAVHFYLDYKMPLGEMRNELTRILYATPRWDGTVNSLHVTNNTDKVMEVRTLVSAIDAANVWELKCYVREKMNEFLQKNYPQYLPKSRVEVEQSLIQQAENTRQEQQEGLQDY